MLYAMLGTFGASVLAALWMAKRLAYYDAYKPAFMVILIAILGWCLPVFLQVFVLAGFITIGVQYWEETKPAFVAWLVAVVATVALGQMLGPEGIAEALNPAATEVLSPEMKENPTNP